MLFNGQALDGVDPKTGWVDQAIWERLDAAEKKRLWDITQEMLKQKELASDDAAGGSAAADDAGGGAAAADDAAADDAAATDAAAEDASAEETAACEPANAVARYSDLLKKDVELTTKHCELQKNHDELQKNHNELRKKAYQVHYVHDVYEKLVRNHDALQKEHR